ncbi:hypothetical protein DSL72_008402 [Monilinia vaccinii-corymbosi]|uniref:Uncharacterized protein n=1 Tax=Monilinia vaccinii-corymbosi TaxID=61207 RepID=A0A8A3PJM3_9HELO|nr:hypothetical protein DSL72_008402 [Monilinia vaccinii-corymbosi]
MPSQTQLQRARQQQEARDLLHARREAAAKKAAERKEAAKSGNVINFSSTFRAGTQWRLNTNHNSQMAPDPAKTTTTAEKSGGQAHGSKSNTPLVVPSAVDQAISIPRIKKKAGTSMADKKAAEQAAAAAKAKRAKQEKDEGEISSDDGEVAFKSRQKKSKNISESVRSMGKTPSISSSRADPLEKREMAVARPSGTQSAMKVHTKAPNRRDGIQASQPQKESGTMKLASKRKVEDSDTDSSKEETIKLTKKQKTTAKGGGMNFGNSSSKRKHAEEDEATVPVKKQKTMEHVKKAVAAPAKRTPAVKETHFVRDPNVNLLNFGSIPKKPAQKKAPAAPTKTEVVPQKKVPVKSETVTEKKEVSKKARKTAQPSIESTVARTKPRTVPGTSTSTAPSTRTCNIEPRIFQSPPVLTSVPEKIKSFHQGTSTTSAPPSSLSSSSPTLPPTVPVATASRSSKPSSNLSPSKPAPRKRAYKGKKITKCTSSPKAPARKLPATRKVKDTEIVLTAEEKEMTRDIERILERVLELEQDEVQESKQPEAVVEVNSSLAVDLDPDQDALLKVDMDCFINNLQPEVAAAVQAQQKIFDQSLGKAKESVVDSGNDSDESVEGDDESSVDEDGIKTIKVPLPLAPVATSPPSSIENIELSEQRSVVAVDESLHRDDGSNQNTNVAPQQTRYFGSMPEFKYAYEIGYEEDMSEEDPDPEPTPAPSPAPSIPFEEAGDFDELELDIDAILEAQQAEGELEVIDQEKKKSQSLTLDNSPSSSVDAVTVRERSLSVADSLFGEGLEQEQETPQSPVLASPPSSLDTSFTSLNDSRVSTEQPSSVEDDNTVPDAKTDGPEEAVAGVKSYQGRHEPDGHSNFTPPPRPGLDKDANEDVEISSDDDDSHSESDKESDRIFWDDRDTEELFQDHMVPAELANVVPDAGSINYEKLIAETKSAREEAMRWERKNGSEPEFTFSVDRAEILRRLGYPEKRIVNYMEVHKRYEYITIPSPAAQYNYKTELDGDETSGDESSEEEDCHTIGQRVSILTPREFSWNHDDMITDPNFHPFGPIN